jgi:hypothetical protein
MNLLRIFNLARGSVSLKTINDEFITWLTFTNAGMVHPGNPYCMDYAIQHLPTNDPILEIGSFCGLSTNMMLYLLRKYRKKNKFFTCDRWIVEHGKSNIMPTTKISFDEYKTFIKKTFIRNIKFFSPTHYPHTIELFSEEFFPAWRKKNIIIDVFNQKAKLGGPISFCYIDGNHSYPFAKRDYLNCTKYLVKYGFLFFDDSFDGSTFEVAGLMKEVTSGGKYRIVMKNPNYLFQKI